MVASVLVAAAMTLTMATPAEEYEAVADKVNREQQKLIDAYRAATTKEAKEKILAEYEKLAPEHARAFLTLARKYPQSKEAAQALAWIIGQVPNLPVANEAVDLIAKGHTNSTAILDLLPRLQESGAAASERLYRAVLDKADKPQTRGLACFYLAGYLKNTAETIRALESQGDGNARKDIDELLGPERTRQLQGKDAAAWFDQQAEQCYQRAATDFGDIEVGRQKIAEAVKPELYEMKHLAIGKTAPDIVGKDLDDKPLKLSDFRGKVVVLSFWGLWCGPCRAQLPHEKQLVKRLAEQPFVFLGIDTDEDRAEAKKVIDKEGITWKNWFDGPDGPIVTRWNVQRFPTTYVLDKEGVVRFKYLRGAALDRAVDRLLAEKK